MNTTRDITADYPYTTADLERVHPSQIREGDLLASAGPVGSGRFAGRRVLADAAYVGYSKTSADDIYSIEEELPNGSTLHLRQPSRIHVWRVRADRRQVTA